MSVGFVTLLQAFAIAYAMIAGVFLAFSDFIMRALSKTRGAGGVEAMQSINREVFRWIFMVLFIGLAPASLALSVYALFALDGVASIVIAVAGFVYAVGCFGLTAARNVPMNDALAALEPASAEAGAYWRQTYLPRWTFWNSVRAVACLLAAALLLLASGPALAV